MATAEIREEKQQLLKIGIHCAVGAICEKKKTEDDITFSRQFIATVADLTVKQIGLFAEDLELFAKHAKRTVIKPEDVKLLVRKSPELLEHITKMTEKLSSEEKDENAAKKKTAGPSKRKKTSTTNDTE